MTAAFGEAEGMMFGEGVNAGWEEQADTTAATDDVGEALPNGGEFKLVNGHKFVIYDAQWRALLHHPYVVSAITQRAQNICDYANSLVSVEPQTAKRLGEMPAYDISVQNQPDTQRARARVKPRNLLGRFDEALNSTLYKAMEQYPSDPKPGIGPDEDTVQPPAPDEYATDMLYAGAHDPRGIGYTYSTEGHYSGVVEFTPEAQ
jgi:hypothetical protein